MYREPLVIRSVGVQAASGFRANRLRATSAAAAAPNSSTIGGAGTGAGEPLDDPVDPLDEPVEPLDPVDPLLEDDVLVLKPWLLDPYWF